MTMVIFSVIDRPPLCNSDPKRSILETLAKMRVQNDANKVAHKIGESALQQIKTQFSINTLRPHLVHHTARAWTLDQFQFRRLKILY